MNKEIKEIIGKPAIVKRLFAKVIKCKEGIWSLADNAYNVKGRLKL